MAQHNVGTGHTNLLSRWVLLKQKMLTTINMLLHGAVHSWPHNLSKKLYGFSPRVVQFFQLDQVDNVDRNQGRQIPAYMSSFEYAMPNFLAIIDDLVSS